MGFPLRAWVTMTYGWAALSVCASFVAARQRMEEKAQVVHSSQRIPCPLEIPCSLLTVLQEEVELDGRAGAPSFSGVKSRGCHL